jgi:hypothetical protein
LSWEIYTVTQSYYFRNVLCTYLDLERERERKTIIEPMLLVTEREVQSRGRSLDSQRILKTLVNGCDCRIDKAESVEGQARQRPLAYEVGVCVPKEEHTELGPGE